MADGDEERGTFQRVGRDRGPGPGPGRENPRSLTRVGEQPWTEGLATPRVRLAQVSLDESMFSIIVRIDEALRTRNKIGDTETLNRIQDLFTSRFRDFGL
jgi:hypothetical protein